MKYVYAAKISELPKGSKKKVTIDGQDILLVHIEHSYYAVDNVCPHMGGSLFDGNLDGSLITCPKHGSVFDVKDGKVRQAGKILMFKVNPRALKSFPVNIVGDNIMIQMEE